MEEITRILIVEDLVSDYELAQREIRKSVQNCSFERVEKQSEFLQALEEFQPDVIVCDYQLPDFTGLDALEITQESSPSTPLIIWTGAKSEDIAVDCMKKGASNYVLKERIKRLGPAVVHALEERRLRIERDHAQTESRAREQEFRTITEDITELICRFKPDGVLTYVNNVYCEYFGKSRAELIGTSFIPLGVADFSQKHVSYFNSFSSEQPIKTFEQYDYRSDGTKRWREWVDRGIFNDQGELIEIQSTGRDITRRKEAEEKYRVIFENSPVGVFQSTPDGKYLSANPTLAHIYGFASPQEMIAQVHDIASEVYVEAKDRQQFLRPLNEKGVINDFEMKNRKKDGSIIWTSTSARVVRDEAGSTLYYEGFLQDITQRKQAEDALKYNEMRFRALIENGLDDISLLDVDGNLLWESPSTVRNLGYSPNQFVGQNIFAIMHPDDLGWATELFRELIQKPGSHQHQSFRLQKSDGTWHWVEAITTNMLHEPAVQAIVVNYRDITERKETEQAIHESEEKYRLLFESNPMPMWIYDLETLRFLKVNDAAVGHYGYSVEDFLGMTIKGIRPSEDVPKLLENIAQSDRNVSQRVNQSGIWRHCKKDGTVILVDIVSHEVEFEGRKAELVLANDVTKRNEVEKALRNSESKYRVLAENSLQGIAIYQGQKIVYANPAMCQINGYTVEELMAMSADQIVALTHPDDRVIARERAGKRGAGETLSPGFEGRILRKDGTTAWLQSFNNPIEFDGKPALLSTMLDITQRKQAEVEREALLDIMQGLANTKDIQEFLEIVHHSVGKTISAENFFIVLHHEDSGLFEEIYSVDQYDPPAPPSRLERSITSYVFRTGEPLLLTQQRFDELVAQGEAELVGTNSASWLGIPLKTSNGTIGVMAVQDYENPKRYSERDKDFLASIASQVALAIERKQADNELKQTNDELALLNTINEAVVRGQNLDSIVELLSSELRRIFSSVGSTVYMLSPDKQSIIMQQYSFSPEIAQKIEKLLGFTIPRIEIPVKEGGYFHKAMISRQSAITVDPQEIQNWIAEFAETKFLPRGMKAIVRKLIPHIHKLLNIKSTIVVPLLSEEETIGFLDVSSSDVFTVHDLKRIERIGGQLTTVIQRQKAETAEREQRALAEALRDTAETLNSNLDYGEVLDRILAAVASVVPHDAATIMLIDGESAYVVRSHGFDEHDFHAEIMGIRLPLAETNNLRQMLETGQTLIIYDTQAYEGWKRKPITDWLRANVGAPISIHGEIIGFILLDSETVGFFTPLHATRLEAFANQAAIAIHNSRLLQRAQEEIHERKYAEQALRESEAIYRQAIEVAGSVPYYQVYDGDGTANKFKFIGEGIRQITGYGPEEIDTALWDSLIEESILIEDLAGYSQEEAIRRVRSGENPVWKCEERIRDREGNIHWVFEAAVELRDENGISRGSIGTFQDITTRKQAEVELRASEERFRQLATNIEEAFWMTDAQTNKEIYISPVAATIWGNSVEYFMNTPDAFLNSIMKEDQAPVLASLEKQRKGEKTEIEYRILHADGSTRWIWDRAFPVFDENGNIKIVAGIAADITERKQNEIALLESQARYHDLFDSSPISLWEEDYSLVKKRIEILQQNGVTNLEEYLSTHPKVILELASLVKVTDVNRVSLQLYHARQKEELLRSLPEFVSNDTLQHFQDEILSLIRTSRFEWEGKDQSLDGSELMVMVHGSIPPGYEETWSKVIVSISDITERKRTEEALRESEERFSSAFEYAPIGIALVSPEGRWVKVNQALCELLGYTKQELLTKTFQEITHPDDLDTDLDYVEQTLKGERASYQMEKRYFHKSGNIVWALLSVSLVKDHEGKPQYFISQIQDITERKRAEHEIQRHIQETGALLQTSLALTNLDLKAILQSIGSSAKTLFAANGCRIFLMQPDGEYLRCVLALQEDSSGFTNLRLKVGDGVTGSVAASGQAEIVNETQNDLRAVQVPGTEDDEKEAIMFAPLKQRDQTLGVLSVHRAGNERPFEPADLELLEAFASMAASAVSDARLFEEAQQRLSELEALYENGLAVGQLLEPSEIGTRIIETFARYLSWHHVAIRLLRPETDNLEVIAFNQPGLSESEKVEMERHFNQMVSKTGRGLSGWVVQTGNPLRTGNVHSHPQYVDTQAGIESGLYMPLKIGDRIIGVISVESDLLNAFTEQDERLLATLASQAAIAFENARLYKKIQLELTERKKAEDALRTSQTHYRDLADSITDILFEVDHDLRYIHWNKASEIFSGIPAEDVIGKSMQEVFGDSEDSLQREKIYRSVLREQKAEMFQTEIVPGGQNQKRILEINAYPSARGVSVVAKDVTERKRNETLLERRFELMEYTGHHELNEMMQKTVDIISEMTGSHIGFYFFVGHDEKTLNMQICSTETMLALNVAQSEGMHLALDQAGVWAEAARQRRSVIHNDYASLPHKKGMPDGHIPIIRELAVPIIRNERLVALIGVGNKESDYAKEDLEIVERFTDYAWDITERKQMENQLADERVQLARRVEERTADLSRANSNLARALRVKDEFLANMSHELRTPLNAILGLSESLGEQVAGPLNEKQQKYLTTINESGHHLLSLINDILDLAKIEAGQITLDINKVDVNSVCQASLRMVKQLAQKKNQDIVLEIDNDLGLMWADERRLKQMLVNLLSNAVKFTPEAGRLGLEVHGDRTGNKVTLTVWDNGIGISSRDMERLFRPFVQLDGGLAREATGTGLGLALVAQMARLHGGSVTVQSQPGEGSRFSIQLPWEPALASDAAIRLRNTGKFQAIDPHAKNKATILLIEDTKEVVMMLVDYLEMAGYKVVTAQDGIDGIAQAKLSHPNLILMDIQMPRMDGFETTQKLRNDPEFKNIPIIALTALAMSNDRERCLEAGMDEYISKPVNLKALTKMIRQFLFESQESPPS